MAAIRIRRGLGIFEDFSVIIVSPYKRYEYSDQNQHHGADRIGEFDWIDALRMLSVSAERFGYPVYALTDGELATPNYRYHTQEENLMLWILEISLCFSESAQFTEDVAFVCPDSLINNYLPSIGGFDLGICVRFDEKYSERPILNSVQLWPYAGRKKLAAFYRECLKVARNLPGGPAWGADTVPLVQLLSPLSPGFQQRSGINVLMLPAWQLMRTIHKADITALANGDRPMVTSAPVIDFKAGRKKHMKAYFEAIYANS